MNHDLFARNVTALMAKCPDLTHEVIQAVLQEPCHASLVNQPSHFPNIRFEHNGQPVHLYEGSDPLLNIQAMVDKQLSNGPVSHI